MEPQHQDFLILLSSDEIQQRVKQLAKQIERDILVEDIIDTGLTLSRLTSLLSKKRPRTLRIAYLLNKPTRRRVPIEIDYTGFTINDEFVFGYGLDLNEQYRHLPYLATLK